MRSPDIVPGVTLTLAVVYKRGDDCYSICVIENPRVLIAKGKTVEERMEYRR